MRILGVAAMPIRHVGSRSKVQRFPGLLGKVGLDFLL